MWVEIDKKTFQKIQRIYTRMYLPKWKTLEYRIARNPKGPIESPDIVYVLDQHNYKTLDSAAIFKVMCYYKSGTKVVNDDRNFKYYVRSEQSNILTGN